MITKIDSSTNFKAIRLATVTNYKKNFEIIDIVRLNKKDDEFIRQCYDTLNNNPLTKSSKRLTLQKFLQKFLQSSDKSDCPRKGYILAIKNRSEIVAGYEDNRYDDDIKPNKAFYMLKNYKFVRDCLFYGLINDVNSSRYRYYGANSLIPFYRCPRVIKSRHHEAHFFGLSHNEENIDLYEHLKINKYEM